MRTTWIRARRAAPVRAAVGLALCLAGAAAAGPAAEPVDDSPAAQGLPVFPALSSRFVAGCAVEIVAPPGASGIVYTVDGRLPTLQSPRYAKPIFLARTTRIRARAVGPGSPPSLGPVAERQFEQVRATHVRHARINFQPAGAPRPWSWLVDTGAPFHAREGGVAYGWNRDVAALTRERGRHDDPSQDTLILVDAGAVWEMAVRNRDYTLTIGLGDAAEAVTNQALLVEGQVFCEGVSLPAGAFRYVQKRVTVKDGLLTVHAPPGAAAGAAAPRMCWLEFAPYAPPADPAASDPPRADGAP